MSADSARDLDLALRALADPNRRALLAAVRDSPRSVGELAVTVGLSQQATSHHLRVLHAAGLARGTREGTRHLFAIDTDGLAAVRSYLDDFWPTRLAALKTAIESDSGGKHSSDGESDG
jgi:DNA-binding transcriptional ArsR family regulator